jgi:hypothetical protein
LDWGRAITQKEEVQAARKLPGPPANPYDEAAVKKYFRNLGSQPFVENTQALDYSLQLARGVSNFRAWVERDFPAKSASVTDVPAFEFPPDLPTTSTIPTFGLELPAIEGEDSVPEPNLFTR